MLLEGGPLRWLLDMAFPYGTRRRELLKAGARFVRNGSTSMFGAVLPSSAIKVSVVVPVYNAEMYMRRCLDSLRMQDLFGIEFICVNDGSTDRSLDILKFYARMDRRFIVIDQSNKGYGAAINRGFRIARGKYVATLDPDDWIEPAAYKTLFEAAERHGSDIAKAGYWEVNRHGDFKRSTFERFPLGTAIAPSDHPDVLPTIPTIWAALYRREMIESYSIYLRETPGSTYQDASFVHRCWMAAQSVVLLDGHFVHYWNDRGDSATNPGGNVFAVCGEYALTEGFMCEDDERRTAFAASLAAAKFSTYRWNFNRILPKERVAFCERWAKELRAARDAGWLRRDVLGEDSWLLAERIEREPEEVAKLSRL